MEKNMKWKQILLPLKAMKTLLLLLPTHNTGKKMKWKQAQQNTSASYLQANQGFH